MRKMFVTDYDGTLAADDGKVSDDSIKALHYLGKQDVIRVIATGRSLFSLKTVVKENLPIDYLVFSSGIGIYDWKNNKLLSKSIISKSDTSKIFKYLSSKKYDFMVQLPVPENHIFYHHIGENPSPDLVARKMYYASYGIEAKNECPEEASQFVIAFPEERNYFNEISEKFPNHKVLKATSPIDKKTIWLEIVPKTVSKSHGIEFIKNRYDVLLNDIVSVGNDYYDIDMLRYVQKKSAFVVSNAPKELKNEFKVILSNQENAVARLIHELY